MSQAPRGLCWSPDDDQGNAFALTQRAELAADRADDRLGGAGDSLGAVDDTSSERNVDSEQFEENINPKRIASLRRRRVEEKNAEMG